LHKAKAIFILLKSKLIFPYNSFNSFMLCLVNTLFMWFKAGATKGKKATDVGSSLGVSSLHSG